MEPIDDPDTAGTHIPGGRAARIRARLGVALVVLLVLLAGCGGKGGSRGAAPGSSTTSTTAPATFPLTGLPSGGAAAAARPALSVPVGTVASRLHRARRKLRAALPGLDASSLP